MREQLTDKLPVKIKAETADMRLIIFSNASESQQYIKYTVLMNKLLVEKKYCNSFLEWPEMSQFQTVSLVFQDLLSS